MSPTSPDITFVVSRSGDPSIFERNFTVSPCLEELGPDRIIVREGFSSAASAYNDALDRANTDLVVFAHQDVFFPHDWIAHLDRSLSILEKSDPDWGVLGCWGVNNRGLEAGFLYSVGLGMLGSAFVQPVAVDTLDEFVLIMRKSSGLRFDPTLPHFHFYGTDICMSARKNKKSCYAISAFSVHNTSYGFLSPEFYECYWHIKRRWKEFLPIQTSCIRMTLWNEELIARRAKSAAFRLLGRKSELLPRLEDPRSALRFVPSQADSL